SEAPAPRGGWNRAQFRAWARESRRWAIHLLRKRSWVLPPKVGADIAGTESSRRRPDACG
ncbi:MAG: hypothetical protein ACREUG_15100, partial [Steroidobacteraceae bacterium]